MAISREKVSNRMEDLKKSLAAVDSDLAKFREAVGSSIGFSDPIIQDQLFKFYSDMLEISARLMVYAAAPMDGKGNFEKYFNERSGVFDLILHGIPPARGISESRDLIRMAYFLSARNECEIWRFSTAEF